MSAVVLKKCSSSPCRALAIEITYKASVLNIVALTKKEPVSKKKKISGFGDKISGFFFIYESKSKGQ